MSLEVALLLPFIGLAWVILWWAILLTIEAVGEKIAKHIDNRKTSIRYCDKCLHSHYEHTHTEK